MQVLSRGYRCGKGCLWGYLPRGRADDGEIEGLKGCGGRSKRGGEGKLKKTEPHLDERAVTLDSFSWTFAGDGMFCWVRL